MVGRGAREIPGSLNALPIIWETGELLPGPTLMEVRDMILRHGKMLTEYKGEMIAMREMRSHMAWYTKGMRNSAALRCEINQVETLEGLAELLEKRMEAE